MLLLLASFMPAARAQTIVHEYYVPLPEAQLRTALVGIEPASGRVGNQIESVISVVIAAPGTAVHYDHWEDGYELNLNAPTQASTQIWGDGNDANGIAPGFAQDPLGLSAGTVLSLRNTVSLPRNPSTVLYDGRDRIGGTKAIVLSRANWPLQPGSVLGGAVEITPTLDYGTEYVAPVGVDVMADSMFEYTGLFVMARENATSVLIDLDGDGPGAAFAVTLNRGESHLVNNGVKKGATISAGKPVQAHLITGDIGAGYETRWQTLYPVDQWSNSYYSPVGSAANGHEAYVFLYNHQASAITIEAETRTGTTSFNVPAKGVHRFLLPRQSGTRFSSSGKFFGIAVIGARPSSNNVHDWGFTLIPADSLTTEAVCGWGPGSSDLSRNGSPVWVMTQGATRIYVDYNGDRAGALTDPKGGKYDIHYDMSVLESRTLYDPDRDQTAMRVYTLDGTLITAAWGQDPAVAGAANPFLDLGTSVLPFPVPQLKKRWELLQDNGAPGLSVGDVLRYFITVDNRGLLPLGNLNILDPLATGLSYMAGTTTLNGSPLADSPSGTPFPLDAPGYTIPSIPRGGKSVFTYDATVTVSGQIDNTVTSVGYGLTGTSTAMVPQALPNAGAIRFTDSFAAPKAFYEVGEGVWIEIVDNDLNQDTLQVETFQVVVTNSGTGDIEIVTLTETGPNSGVFRSTASLPTSTVGGIDEQDGTLYALAGNSLSVEYTDPLFFDTTSASALVAAPSMVKPLYLSADAADGDSTGALDRVDPVASADASTAQTAAISAGTATVAFDSASSATTGNAGASSLTFSHTTGNGSNRLLLVGVSIGNTSIIAPTISSVTYNGVNLTFVQGISGGTGTARPRTEIWRLVNPPSGDHSVVITTSGGTARGLTAGAVTFSGVDATTPLGTPVTGSANSTTSASLNVSTAVGEMVFDSITIGNYDGGAAPAVTFGADQSNRWSQASAYATSGTMYIRGSGSTHVSTGASKDMTRSWSTNQSWSGIAVAIKPAASAATPVVFTQTPSFQAPFSMPAGGVVTVKAYYSLVSGSIGSAVTAELKHGATTFFTDASATTGSDANGNYLQWSGALGAGVTIPASEAVSLTVTSNLAAGNSFRILYDSQTKPSVIQLPASTVIEVDSLGLYDAPYPGGNPVTAANNGATLYVRTVVTDPFGHADITRLDLAIDGPGTNGDVSTTLTDTSAVAASGAQKTYEYAWTTGTVEGGFSIAVTAHEGLENDISDSRVASFNLSFNDSGTPSQTQFTATLNGVATSTYAANSPVFVRVTDIDQNLDPGAVDTVQVVVTTNSGDVESLVLIETGNDTGVFVGTLPASTAAGSDGDGTLHAPAGAVLAVNYVDPDDSADATSANASIPLGTPSVVTAITRLSPATVPVGDTVSFLVEVSNNGSVPLPTVALTQTFTAAGLNYLASTLAPNTSSLAGPLGWNNVGPLAVGASIQFTVTFTAVGPAAPATVNVAANAGGGVTHGSLATVTVVAPALTLTKTLHQADNNPAGIGDLVTFRIVLENTGNTAIAQLPLEDSFSGAVFDFVSASIAPDGTAYGSLFWDDLTGAGNLAVGDSITLDVVLRAKGSANPAVTTARADYTVDSNGLALEPVSAEASIVVTAATFTGTVYDDADGSGAFTAGEVGLQDAVVTLYTDPDEDGNPADGVQVGYTVTDAAGRYEFPFLAKGFYVIVLDGLPPGYTSTAANQIALEVDEPKSYDANHFFARFNTIAVGVGDVAVNEASDYAIFKVTGANGDAVRLELGSSGGLGAADIAGFTVQVFDGWDWVNYTPGSYVGILSGGVLPVRVNITSEQDDVFEDVEAFTLTATPLTGSAATGTGRIYDDGTGDIFLASNITGNPSPASLPGYPPLDDDRQPSVNAPVVNEVSDHVIFQVSSFAGQKLKLELGTDADPVTTDADIAGFTLEYWDGAAWQPYIDDSFVTVPVGGLLLVRVNITSEQDDDDEGPEVFTLSASTTSGTTGVGVGTIRDDGTGDVFLDDNTTGDPDNPALPGYPELDDDRVLAPAVLTLGVENVTAFKARINGRVTPNNAATTAWFEWSTDPAMITGVTATAVQSLGAGKTAVDYWQDLTGLIPETVYYYRAVAENSEGRIAGATLSFVSSYPYSTSEGVAGLPAGVNIYRPMPGAINEAGRITSKFYAYLGMGGVTAADDAFIMSDASGVMTVLGREGQNVPGLGVMRGFFEDIVMTHSGASIFTENFAVKGRTNTAYLISEAGTPPLQIIRKTNDTAPGGGVFKTLLGVPAADQAECVYFGGARSGSGINAKRDTGVWADEAGHMDALVLEGTPVPGMRHAGGTAKAGQPNAWYGNIRNQVVAGGFGTAFIASFQNNPDNAKDKTLAAQNMAAFALEAGEEPQVIARKGLSVPGGGTWLNLQAVSRGAGGDHLVLGLMARKGGVTVQTDQALVAVSADGQSRLVAREGVTVVPGTGNLKIDRFVDHYLSSTGEVVFRAYLRGALAGSGQVVCRWRSGAGLSVVLREGDTLPPPLAPHRVGIIQRMTVSAGGNIGLLVTNSNPAARSVVLRDLVAAPGLQVVEYSGRTAWYRNVGMPILTLSIFESRASSGGTGGLGVGINDAGQMAVTLDLGSTIHVIKVYD
jgi:uncharacterized repeat protein (TIGR01451 family)